MLARIFAALAALAALASAQKADSTNGWGYGYDSLLNDLAHWRTTPAVKVDSIGASVENRAIWMVTITDGTDSVSSGKRKHRVFMHVRTHPAEVQAEYVANAAIAFLTGPSAEAASLRRDFIFNIVPMYNPDGVEDGHARQNAHLVDLEGNWDKPTLEPEPAALKKTFQRLMGGPIPIEVALNLHSDQLNCTRFFIWHYPEGTSPAYASLETDFIEKVRAYFPAGIEEWHFVKTWPDAPQARYPEGFWWLNYHEQVMALTYEDRNCPGAGEFDSTARALVLGSADYIRARASVSVVSAQASSAYRIILRDGAPFLVGPRGAPAPWILVDADGRSLGKGILENGAARLPVGSLPRPAWLVIDPGRGGTAIPMSPLPR